MKNKTLIIIAGPTASGKTAASIEAAKYFNTEIISADSRQFYKEMNIGTAKPSPEELSAVPHHFIDFLPLEEKWSAAKFEKEALNLLEKLFKKHDVVICTGGSGLYIKALTEGFDEMPSGLEKERKALTQELKEKGLSPLLQELKHKDPEYYAAVDKNNRQRIIRALEVMRGTGKPFSEFRKGERKERPFNIVKTALKMNRDQLYDRINKRVDEMIEAGLFEEAEKLYPKRELNALQTVGYTEIFDYMEGKYDREEAIRLIKRNTRRYAKRQITLFNKQGFEWVEPGKVIQENPSSSSTTL